MAAKRCQLCITWQCTDKDVAHRHAGTPATRSAALIHAATRRKRRSVTPSDYPGAVPKGHILCDPTSRNDQHTQSTETATRPESAGAWEEGAGGGCYWYGVSFWGDESVPEFDSDDVFTTLTKPTELYALNGRA